MKELSMEEKSKLYDEALEKARKLYEQGTITESLCYVFPELKESEDERIRQFLIHEVTETSDEIMSYRNMNKKDVLAWLEKQGEHANFRNKIQIGDKVTRNKDGVLVNLSQLNRVAKKDEKQGEQKPTIIIPRFRVGDEIKTTNEAPLTITKITDSGYWSEDLFICSFENSTKWELVEQKPADKVEPKFKVGDWVVRGKTIAQILDVQEQYYVGLDIDGNDFTSSKFLSDDKIHLWTIQDAKDGDVLFHSDTASNGIFVFKEILQCGTIQKVVCYCDYDSEDGFCLGEKHTCCWTDSKILRPATKEQRDLLFQKMHEAGYEWDAEKKELTKIKHNSAWSEDDDKILKSIIINIENLQFSEDMREKYHHIPNANKSYYQIKIDWLKSLKDKVQPQPKQEWSEEDEEIYKKVETAIDSYYAPFSRDAEEMSEWFKNLKDRVQPKQEWNEEDEEMYKEVLTDIIYAKNDLKVKECLGLSKRAMKAFNWFSKRYKSLKPQNWTKEDKERYISCLQRLGTGNPEQPETINSKWFKEHVYPQSTWKPSNEQIGAIEAVINNRSFQTRHLYSLYEQLKKLREEQLWNSI